MSSFDEQMEAQAWHAIADRPPGPAAAGFQAGIQHERTRVVCLLGHRALELRGTTDPAAVGARQEIIRLMALIQNPDGAA